METDAGRKALQKGLRYLSLMGSVVPRTRQDDFWTTGATWVYMRSTRADELEQTRKASPERLALESRYAREESEAAAAQKVRESAEEAHQEKAVQALYNVTKDLGEDWIFDSVDPSIARTVGNNYEERLFNLAGYPHRYHDSLFGPFGTNEKPTLVPSSEPFRYIGFKGGYGDDAHDVIYMRIRRGPKHACPKCGQIFLLTNEHISDPKLDRIMRAAHVVAPVPVVPPDDYNEETPVWKVKQATKRTFGDQGTFEPVIIDKEGKVLTVEDVDKLREAAGVKLEKKGHGHGHGAAKRHDHHH